MLNSSLGLAMICVPTGSCAGSVAAIAVNKGRTIAILLTRVIISKKADACVLVVVDEIRPYHSLRFGIFIKRMFIRRMSLPMRQAISKQHKEDETGKHHEEPTTSGEEFFPPRCLTLRPLPHCTH